MSLYIIYVFHKTILFTDVDGLIFGKSIIITNSTDACMYDIHIATGNKQPGDCFLTNMTHLTFFSVDSHERVFYYVDHSMSSIKKVDMITKIEQILYMGTVGAETISGMYILRVSDCCLTPIQQEENRRCTIQKKRDKQRSTKHYT